MLILEEEKSLESVLAEFDFSFREDHYVLCFNLSNPHNPDSWKFTWTVHPSIEAGLIPEAILDTSGFIFARGIRASGGGFIDRNLCWQWPVPQGTPEFIRYAFVAALVILPFKYYSGWTATIIPDDRRPIEPSPNFPKLNEP